MSYDSEPLFARTESKIGARATTRVRSEKHHRHNNGVGEWQSDTHSVMHARDAERRVLSERDPDAELIGQVGREEPGAVRSLVARKLPRLLALATRMLGDRMEAEDVAQEVFVRIWKQAPRWREGEAKFDTWVHRVALNLCYDRLRGRREDPHDDLPDEIDPAAQPEATLEARAQDERVREALAALPARQREALVLNYYQELSNVEAAALMGITVDALESLLARARRNLRAQLAGSGLSKDTS